MHHLSVLFLLRSGVYWVHTEIATCSNVLARNVVVNVSRRALDWSAPDHALSRALLAHGGDDKIFTLVLICSLSAAITEPKSRASQPRSLDPQHVRACLDTFDTQAQGFPGNSKRPR